MFTKSNLFFYSLVFNLFFCFTACNPKKEKTTLEPKTQNVIEYASGFELYPFADFSILKITQPWPGKKTNDTYILYKDSSKIPDSLQGYTAIQVPIKNIIATSTTHIPPLEMLGVEHTLLGFPGTDYISSVKTRQLIGALKIKNLGQNESINVEQVINLQPSVLVGFGIDGHNPTMDLLKNNGIKILFNGDWTEPSPLGKAEWIKLFGALYGLDQKANTLFNEIVASYNQCLDLVKKTANIPTVMSGGMYQGVWYTPQGESWAAHFYKQAKTNYIWKSSQGTGSLSLPFEVVYEKAKNADYWIDVAQYGSLQEMINDNAHYKEFKAFQTKKVYSSSVHKGAKGGIWYYELAPMRPDLVLKDIIKITHPELLPNYQLYFFTPLQ